MSDTERDPGGIALNLDATPLLPQLADIIRRRLEAQARQAELEAERAELELAREAARWEIERERLQAEAAKLRIEEEQARIALERTRRQWREEEVSNRYRHVYVLTGTIDDHSVDACIERLSTWSRLEPGCPITLVLRSPGGYVIPGFHLFDTLVELRERGHHITTYALGYAASMAGILLQAGTRRIMGRNAWLLVHELGAGTWGKLSEIEDEVKWARALMDRVTDIFVSRSRATNAPKKLTRSKFQSMYRRKNCWLSAREALEMGIVDEVGPDVVPEKEG